MKSTQLQYEALEVVLLFLIHTVDSENHKRASHTKAHVHCTMWRAKIIVARTHIFGNAPGCTPVSVVQYVQYIL